MGPNLEKFEQEELNEIQHHELNPLRFRASTVNSWIDSVRQDWKQLRQLKVPIHLEVIARITISSFLGYVLALGNFPNLVPESQRVLIAMLSSTLGMIFPTLMFSVGMICFPQMIFVCLLSLAFATMLLACAAGVGLGFYVAMFGVTALLISGMRFDKKTGGMTCFLVVEMALNSQPLARIAAENGMDVVRSLWTETGVANPRALYMNTLVGMMWIVACIVVGRIIPPFRTARSGIVKGLLPGSLNAVADSIDLNAEDLHCRQPARGKESDGDHDDGPTPDQEIDNDGKSIQERRDPLVAKLIHQKSILSGANVAGITAFEPRMLRFGPPECSWIVLQSLCTAVDRVIVSSLALGDVWRDPHDLTVALEEQLIPSHLKAAACLRKCAEAITNGSSVHADKEEEEEAPETSQNEVLDSMAIDPVLFETLSRGVVVATNNWAECVGPPDRTKPLFDKTARKAMELNAVPWIKGSALYIIRFVQNFVIALSPDTVRGVFKPPYVDTDKASWCLDFTVGFTALVSMGIYWEEFVNLDNESWFLIAYAFSTTQTAEGTAKKGILRLLGTAAGGFSGWLGITACGDDGKWGLIVWMTVFTAIAAYIGLPRGFKGRLGLKPDYGFGPSYFVMTQALVIAQVNLGLSDKRTVTLNRISTNAIGIAMAIVLALLPPALYGGNPKYAKQILDVEKSLIAHCIRMLLKHTDTTDSEATSSTSSTTIIEERISKLRDKTKALISKLLAEANDFYSDSAKLRSWKILKVDPKLKDCLDELQVVASWIFVSVGYATQTLKSENVRDKFLEDSEIRSKLQQILDELQSDSEVLKCETLLMPQDEEDGGTTPTNGKSVLFVNSIIIAIRKMQKVDEELQTIKYGLCS